MQMPVERESELKLPGLLISYSEMRWILVKALKIQSQN